MQIDFDCPRCGNAMVDTYAGLKASPLVQCKCGAMIRVEIEIGDDARRDWKPGASTKITPHNDN